MGRRPTRGSGEADTDHRIENGLVSGFVGQLGGAPDNWRSDPDNGPPGLTVGRPERPLDPTAGPVQEFAAALRELRAAAGNPKYEAMARTSGRSRTALSDAAGGDQLPTWETTRAFVLACGGDPLYWSRRWRAAARVEPGSAGQSPTTASPVAVMAPTVTDDEAATGAGELQPTGTPAVPAASRPRQPRAHVPAWLATRRAAVAVLMIGTVGPGAALVAREQSQGSINTSGLVYCQKGHAVDFVHVVSEAGAVSAEVLWRHDNQAFIQTPAVSSGWTVVVGCSASQSGPAYRGRGELTVAAARADWFCGRFERAGSRLCWQVVTDREATAAGPAPGRSRTDPARQDTEKPDTSSPMDAPRATRTPAASETPSATPIAMVAR